MNNDLSIFYLITQASLMVQLVMLILLCASVISWTFIFAKRKQLRTALRAAEEFESRFWSGGDLSRLFTQLNKQDKQADGLEKIFVAGYKEFSRMHKVSGASASEKVENAQRAMRIEWSREMDKLDESLPFLATVGSTSPYVGLFGTVWGIMNSFRALSTAKQATLAQVAPGIAEALVATAIGLFAAIPAVVAYNRFATGIDRLSGRYELFIDEFVVLLQRQAHS
ncbi:MAG: protein TolQ [Gammaproteobacteria bacterium]|nr:MAG: protein TolQ [Gammaproteobacteria bacterium]